MGVNDPSEAIEFSTEEDNQLMAFANTEVGKKVISPDFQGKLRQHEGLNTAVDNAIASCRK